MKKQILSLALMAIGSVTVYGQEMQRMSAVSAATTDVVMDNKPAATEAYHILDLRKMDLDKGNNLTRLKIQPAPDDRTFRNRLAADGNQQEFVFISKEPGTQKLVILLPKGMVLANTYSYRLPGITPRIPADELKKLSTTKVYDENTNVESIPAKTIQE
ncbi:hypothetical protein HDF26_002037 [Pedobacter cryoconitis]|uniref:hypothetical protein n=1 Tax=Pedobacter cryoconitis TaxID=188932 RepID=UPI00160C794C|nr:hypothetical protein [Pedobacter cryoconitis]MBB6271580.1 hypothetical protein [Pedobacter cryoconitis]